MAWSPSPACARAAARARCTACPAVLAFALLAAYTALSIIWSLAPSDSWLETNRTLAYLAVVRGRASRSCGWRPSRWAELLYGVLAGTVVDLRVGAADEGLPGVAGRRTRCSRACARRSSTGTASG